VLPALRVEPPRLFFFFDFDLLFFPPGAGAGAAFGDALYFFRNSTLKAGRIDLNEIGVLRHFQK